LVCGVLPDLLPLLLRKRQLRLTRLGFPSLRPFPVAYEMQKFTGVQAMNQVILLLGAIAAEIVATTSLKLSDGFTRPIPVVITALGYGISFYMLSLTLRRMDLGVAYAVWSGVGTAAMALVGYGLFNENLSIFKMVSIAFIIVGVVGLNVGDTLFRQV
jgi:small multidrug resistance pump